MADLYPVNQGIRRAREHTPDRPLIGTIKSYRVSQPVLATIEEVAMTLHIYPGTARAQGHTDALAAHDVMRYRTAALRARRAYPGPVGELVSRELNAYADFGHRFSSDGLVPRLAEEILATPAQSQSA